jgi:alkylation response protein AidB-like acyl-CoA dehydrogenase
VWSSEALQADCGMLLARTDFGVPKHHGISWFAFSLDQPGVTIRPLREMTGEAVFNEVFLDDAEVADADLIGGQGNGWAVTQTTLYFERTGIGAGGSHAGFPAAGPKGGALGRKAGDAAQDPAPGGNKVIAFDDLRELVRRFDRAGDPEIRQKLSTLWTLTNLGSWNAQRAKADAQSGKPSAVTSVSKILQTKIMKLSAEIALDILGPAGQLNGEAAVDGGRFADAFVFAPASSIYGGSDEIQRNIAAERTLGLPKDERPDKGLTWAEFNATLAGRKES